MSESQESYVYDYGATRSTASGEGTFTIPAPQPIQPSPYLAQAPGLGNEGGPRGGRVGSGSEVGRDVHVHGTGEGQSSLLARPPHVPALPLYHGPRDGAAYAPSLSYGGHAFIPARSQARDVLEILSYEPTKALHGERLDIRVRTGYDLYSPRRTALTIMFATRRCDTTIAKNGTVGAYYDYTLSTDIPSFDTTGWYETQMPVFLSVEDETGQSLHVVEVGEFTYLDASALSHPHSYENAARKRKMSPDAEGYRSSPHPLKRAASQQQLSRTSRDVGAAYQPSSHSPYARPAVPTSYNSMPSTRAPAPYPRRATSYQYPPSGGPASHGPQAPSPSYSPYSTASRPSHSPALAAVPPSPLGTGVAAVSIGSNPPLVRTTTLQPGAAPPGSVHPGFNPYAIYPNARAMLKIDGDLDSMTQNWNRDELGTHRRLVQFTRSQSGSTITTEFRPVSLEERAPNSICISCILWKEKGEHFVTSVDTIYLLESLVAVRFTVEEKNRIRRNLEGFRPMTVAKSKADSEAFFKLIMGFPNPKPRNIEKDVKVFPWKILEQALKKIISKYSASYSSTAGALPPMGPSSYAGSSYSPGDSSSISTSRISSYQIPAPGPSSAPLIRHSSQQMHRSTHYTPPATTDSGLAQSLPSSAGFGAYATDVRSQGLGTPSSAYGATYGALQGWPSTSNPTLSPPLPTGGAYGYGPRPSWDLSSYIDTGPGATAAGASNIFSDSAPTRTPSTDPAGTHGQGYASASYAGGSGAYGLGYGDRTPGPSSRP